MTTIKVEAEIVDIGIEHAQYFQGFGTSYTRFTQSVVGIGNGLVEAYHDAMEQVGQVTENDGVAEAIEQALRDDGSLTLKDGRCLADLTESDKGTGPTVSGQLEEEWKALSKHERGEYHRRNGGDGFEAFTEGCEHHYHVGIRWRVDILKSEPQPTNEG